MDQSYSSPDSYWEANGRVGKETGGNTRKLDSVAEPISVASCGAAMEGGRVAVEGVQFEDGVCLLNLQTFKQWRELLKLGSSDIEQVWSRD